MITLVSRLRSNGGPKNDDLEKSKDYLNANFVDVICQPRAYMANPGPIQSNFLSFWEMVREQNTKVIVIITIIFENGKVRRPKATSCLIMFNSIFWKEIAFVIFKNF